MKMPGKRAQFYGGLETSFGTPPTIAATHAMRHLSFVLNGDPVNRVNSPEKKYGPGRYARFDRRETADFSLSGLLRPSGTLNTLCEASFALEAAMGAKNNITLATTVASSGAVGGATLASAAGLVAKMTAVQIACPDGKLRVRRITSVSGADVTWAPDLPAGQAPATSAAVKGATCYYFTAANAVSIFGARYVPAADFGSYLGELGKGMLVDKLSLTTNWENECQLTASGPAKTRVTDANKPGSFTQVGTNPPSAITAEAMIGSNPVKFMNVGVDVSNGLALRMDEINSSAATEGYRMGDRDVTVAIDLIAEAAYKSALYDLALAGTNASLFKQIGFSTGKIIAIFAPNVDWKAPTTDVGDGAVMWPFKGVALEGVEDANDELVIMLA